MWRRDKRLSKYAQIKYDNVVVKKESEGEEIKQEEES